MIPSGATPNYRPPASAAVATYLDIINPYALLPGDTRSMRRGSQQYAPLYSHLESVLSRTGSWPDVVAAGDYGELFRTSDQLAQDVEDRAGKDFALPYAFGVHSVASIMATLNDTRRGQKESPSSANLTSYFLSQFATHLALRMPDSVFEAKPDVTQLAERVAQKSLILAKRWNYDPAWLQTRSLVVGERMMFRQHLDHVIDLEPTLEVSKTDMDELGRNNDALFNGLQRAGMLTVRSEVYEGHQSNWAISDTLKLRQIQLAKGQGHQVRPAEWPGAFMDAYEMPADVKGVEDPELIQNIRVINESISMRGLFANINDKGLISADLYGAMPLRRLYEKAGKPGNYEVLRQFLMERYFDQSMPVEIVNTVREGTKQYLNSPDPGLDRENGKAYSDLLVPRIRRLRAYQE